MKCELYQGDCFEVMKEIPDGSVDLIITSPPYNVDLGNNKFNKNAYDIYEDNKSHKEYIGWLKKVFKGIYCKVVDGGRVVINVGDGKNGAIPTSSDIIQFMQELNYLPITHIIWNKNSVAGRTAWGSFCSPSCISYPTPFEHIMVFAKGNMKLQHKGESDLTKEEFIKWSLALWTFGGEAKAKEIGHPAPFPVELPYRCIKMNTYTGDTVLDPFMGSGTTGVACQMLGRKFIGIELSEKYFEIAKERIEKEHTENLFVEAEK